MKFLAEYWILIVLVIGTAVIAYKPVIRVMRKRKYRKYNKTVKELCLSFVENLERALKEQKLNNEFSVGETYSGWPSAWQDNEPLAQAVIYQNGTDIADLAFYPPRAAFDRDCYVEIRYSLGNIELDNTYDSTDIEKGALQFDIMKILHNSRKPSVSV